MAANRIPSKVDLSRVLQQISNKEIEKIYFEEK
jgi:hypothetical protein